MILNHIKSLVQLDKEKLISIQDISDGTARKNNTVVLIKSHVNGAFRNVTKKGL